jgi:hypothetical protein
VLSSAYSTTKDDCSRKPAHGEQSGSMSALAIWQQLKATAILNSQMVHDTRAESSSPLTPTQY